MELVHDLDRCSVVRVQAEELGNILTFAKDFRVLLIAHYDTAFGRRPHSNGLQDVWTETERPEFIDHLADELLEGSVLDHSMSELCRKALKLRRVRLSEMHLAECARTKEEANVEQVVCRGPSWSGATLAFVIRSFRPGESVSWHPDSTIAGPPLQPLRMRHTSAHRGTTDAHCR
jgi:hypothetical protein